MAIEMISWPISTNVAWPEYWTHDRLHARRMRIWPSNWARSFHETFELTTYINWVTSWENLLSGIYDQVRFKPACSATEASQSKQIWA